MHPHLQNPTIYKPPLPSIYCFWHTCEVTTGFQICLQSKWWLIYYIIDIHEGMHMVSSLLSTYIYLWWAWTFILHSTSTQSTQCKRRTSRKVTSTCRYGLANFFNLFFHFKGRSAVVLPLTKISRAIECYLYRLIKLIVYLYMYILLIYPSQFLL